MGTVSVKVMRNGKAIQGVKIYTGAGVGRLSDTGKEGKGKKDVSDTFDTVVSSIIVEGDDFTFGGGPFKIEKDKEIVIEV